MAHTGAKFGKQCCVKTPLLCIDRSGRTTDVIGSVHQATWVFNIPKG